MKTLSIKQKLICVLLVAIILAGIAIMCTSGFNKGILYSNHKRVNIYIGIEYNLKDVEEIVKNVVGGNYLVQTSSLSEDYISVSLIDITDEKVEELKTKIYEKYEISEKQQSVKTEEIPAEKITDIVNPYITTFAVTTVILAVYLIIRFRKQNILKVAILSILGTILVELVYFSIIAITRIPFSIFIMPVALIIYIIWFIILAYQIPNKY